MINKTHYRLYLCVSVFALVLTACVNNGDKFKIEGRLLNLNQGEFYIYNTQGALNGIDTVKITGGKFVYTKECHYPYTVMMVFPNFSEIPVFVSPGQNVKLKGDATHLKETEIKGGKENKIMTAFRLQTANLPPPKVTKIAADFVTNNPETQAAIYVLERYFIREQKPDYTLALTLLDRITAKQKQNTYLQELRKQIQQLRLIKRGNNLPAFSALTIDGKSITNKELNTARAAVIFVWEEDSYKTVETLKMLNQKKKQYKDRLKLLGISVSPYKKSSKKYLEKDTITWPNICDEMMFEGKITKLLAFRNIPDNIILHDGVIKDMHLSDDKLSAVIDSLMK